MAKKDYYEILGVDKNADAKAIKNAYRKKAIQYHPDKFAGKSEKEQKKAEEKFKEIAEAYGVLSDEEKRRRYDQYGDENVDFDSGFGGFNGMNINDIFEHFRRSSGFGFDIFNDEANFKTTQEKKGRDIKLIVNVTLEEIYNRVSKVITYERYEPCKTCHGSGLGKNGRIDVCPTCHGRGSIVNTTRRGFTTFQQIAPCPTCNGTGKIVTNPCKSCNGSGLERRTVKKTIQIPVGCCDNSYMPLVGGGNYCERAEGNIGNLIIIFKVEKHADFDINTNSQYDLDTLVDVPVLDCITGGTQSFKGIDGKMHKFNISKGTTDGNVYLLKGCGLPTPNGRYGDLHIYVRQKMPTTISPDELKKIDELKKSKNFQ